MRELIATILDRYESGRVSRRDLIRTIAALAAAAQSAPAASSTFKGAGLNHIAVRVTDIPRTRAFYQGLLGLPIIDTLFVMAVRLSEGRSPLTADRNHLHQILWNLVANALRHGTGGSGSVCLRASPAAATGQVELHVIDDGGGVPEDVRRQIFEPFFTTHHLGTGLGLFIARELCEANGASLELAADTDCGHFILVGRTDLCLLPESSGVRAAN